MRADRLNDDFLGSTFLGTSSTELRRRGFAAATGDEDTVSDSCLTRSSTASSRPLGLVYLADGGGFLLLGGVLIPMVLLMVILPPSGVTLRVLFKGIILLKNHLFRVFVLYFIFGNR